MKYEGGGKREKVGERSYEGGRVSYEEEEVKEHWCGMREGENGIMDVEER